MECVSVDFGERSRTRGMCGAPAWCGREKCVGARQAHKGSDKGRARRVGRAASPTWRGREKCVGARRAHKGSGKGCAKGAQGAWNVRRPRVVRAGKMCGSATGAQRERQRARKARGTCGVPHVARTGKVCRSAKGAQRERQRVRKGRARRVERAAPPRGAGGKNVWERDRFTRVRSKSSKERSAGARNLRRMLSGHGQAQIVQCKARCGRHTPATIEERKACPPLFGTVEKPPRGANGESKTAPALSAGGRKSLPAIVRHGRKSPSGGANGESKTAPALSACGRKACPLLFGTFEKPPRGARTGKARPRPPLSAGGRKACPLLFDTVKKPLGGARKESKIRLYGKPAAARLRITAKKESELD